MEPLDFGSDPSDTSKDVDLSVDPFTTEEKSEASRYDGIQDIQDKRKQAIYDIKTGAIDGSNFPLIFKKLAEVIDKLPDGRFVIRPPEDSYGRGLATKLVKFIQTGFIGDALASKAVGELKKITNDIADETMLHIPTNVTHPMRKIQALMKKGRKGEPSKLDEIIDFNLKKKHYDLFDPKWVIGTLKPMILAKIFELRKSEKALARGEMGEGLEVMVGNLKSIFYS